MRNKAYERENCSTDEIDKKARTKRKNLTTEKDRRLVMYSFTTVDSAPEALNPTPLCLEGRAGQERAAVEGRRAQEVGQECC